MLEPANDVELGDLLEALIAADALDEADGVIEAWRPRAAAVDRAWALAILPAARRCCARPGATSTAPFARFRALPRRACPRSDPVPPCPTLLALGRTHRRARTPAAARSTLEKPSAGFERLGAPLWAEQTRAELARIGGRAPGPSDLTEAERRIAALVAEGHSNREVAAALFLTVHTVETALTRIYRKLGVRSRAALAATARQTAEVSSFLAREAPASLAVHPREEAAMAIVKGIMVLDQHPQHRQRRH